MLADGSGGCLQAFLRFGLFAAFVVLAEGSRYIFAVIFYTQKRPERELPMSRGFNRVILVGNVGKDPELRYTTSGVPVATFSLATTEFWRDKDGAQQERTDWHSLVAWRKIAEIVQEYVHRGSRLLVEGRLQTRSYEKNGEKRFVTEIIADNIVLLDSRDQRDQREQRVEKIRADEAALRASAANVSALAQALSENSTSSVSSTSTTADGDAQAATTPQAASHLASPPEGYPAPDDDLPF
jgi:single-strand DNA-binding protein